MKSPFAEFEAAMSAGLHEMFGAAPDRVPVRAGSPIPSAADVVIATLGFAAEHARGGVTLVASRASMRGLRPIELDEGDDAADCDTLGELANMLVGRTKTKILRRGVVLMLGIPVSAIARDVRLKVHSCDPGHVLYAFDHEHGRLYVSLEVHLDARFTFRDDCVEQQAGAEGDMILF